MYPSASENYLGKTVLETRKKKTLFHTKKVQEEGVKEPVEVTVLMACSCLYGNDGACVHCGGHRDPIRR